MLQRASATHRLLNFEVSYEISIQGPRMTDAARRLLSLLSILPGGVAHGDLDTVFPGQGGKAATILRQVGLAFDQDRRLRLLAPLRAYVQGAHPPPQDDQLLALSHYLDLGRSLGEKAGGEGGGEAIARLTPEAANIEVAIQRELVASAAATAIEAALSFGEFARFTGVGTTAVLEQAAEAAQMRGADDLTASCFFSLGSIALARSDHDTARTHYETARPLYQRVGSLLGEANCIKSQGDIALARSDHDTARTHYETARPLYQRVGDLLGEANCIRSLGDIALARSDHDTARTHYETARPLYQRVGSLLGEANCIQGLGVIALARSDHDTARTHYETALALYERIPEPYSIGWAHRRLARIAADDERRRHIDVAKETWQNIGRDDLVAELIEEFGGE
jgi:tetratricopeptide (TPR) repeat protein